MPANARVPEALDGTSTKIGCCPYAGIPNIEKRRRKSTPNLRLWEPFCRVRLSTRLICRWRLSPLGPTLRLPGNENQNDVKSPLLALNPLGNGNDVSGTAFPKLS